MARERNKKPDPLSVQISFRVRVPKGTGVTKQALEEIYQNWIETGELPPGIEIRGIFWKNSARHGKLSDWRYSSGSDLSVIIPGWKNMTPEEKRRVRVMEGVENSPRGDHDEARSTLKEALRRLRPFSSR